jgi:hypothetical protein
MKEIALREGVDKSHVSRVVNLATLAPISSPPFWMRHWRRR